MTTIIWLLLIFTVAALVLSATFLASGWRDFQSVKETARKSDCLEHQRHIVQQGLKTAKLAMMSTVLIMFLLALPPAAELRTTVIRWLLIAVTFAIAISVVHERKSTKKIVATLLEERTEDVRELADAVEHYCDTEQCALRRDPRLADTQDEDGPGEES